MSSSTNLGPGTLVVVTGAGGPAGTAVVDRLLGAGCHVAAAYHRDTLDAVRERLGGVADRLYGEVVDLLDDEAVRAWADRAATAHPSGAPRVDGVVHLVGGWRGGSRFTDTTVADADLLLDNLVRTLQRVSLAFHDHLLASPRSEFVIVSATAADHPTAGNSAYAAAKAAAEAWTAALADSFAREQEDAPAAAATTLVVRALVHDALRAASPGKDFSGFTDVRDLAREITALWDLDAADANGLRKVLAL